MEFANHIQLFSHHCHTKESSTVMEKVFFFLIDEVKQRIRKFKTVVECLLGHMQTCNYYSLQCNCPPSAIHHQAEQTSSTLAKYSMIEAFNQLHTY